MGLSLSKDCICLEQTADTYGGEGQNVFEVGFDELPLETSFQTDLFVKKIEECENQLILPSPKLISDILNDYLTYTSSSSIKEAFTKVLIPLFNSSPDTKPVNVQIITSLFKFLRERSSPFFANEENRIRALQDLYEGVQADIINAHRRIPAPRFDVSTILNSDESFNQFLQNFNENVEDFSVEPHQTYISVSNRIKGLPLEENNVYKLIKWGISKSEISALLYSLKKLVEISFKSEEKHDDFEFQKFDTFFTSLSLGNSCFSPPANTLIQSTTVKNFTSLGINQTSFICSNGSYIYILGSEKKMTIIDLSKNITRHDDRFSQVELCELEEASKKDIVLTYSNGVILVVSSKEPMYTLYNTNQYSTSHQKNPLEKIDTEVLFSIHGNFSHIPQCKPPFCSDGKYFYSLNYPSSIAVFSIVDNTIVFHRQIKLVKTDATTFNEPYTDDFFPSNFRESLISVTNGFTISFFRLKNSRDENHNYFARHFSLADGRHICDSQFSLEEPITTITYDPWNKCYWGVSSENQAKIISIPAFNTQAPWLTVSDINHMPKFNILQTCKTHADVFSELTNFFEYYSICFSGMTFNAAQSNSNYSSTIARFFVPCTNESIAAIIETISYFIGIYLEKNIPPNFSETKITHLLLSLIRLFDYNLSNIDLNITSGGDGEGDVQKIDFQNEAIQLLMRIIDEPKLEFMHQPTIMTIINSIQLLFMKNIEMLSSIFDKILKQMSEEFKFITLQRLHNLQLYPYCFSVENIPAYFNSIIERYPIISSIEKELIDTFMRSLFMGVRSILIANKQNDPKNSLEHSFITFSNLILDNFSQRLDTQMPAEYTEETRAAIPNLSLFEKYFMMLHVFQSFPTIIDALLFKLHDLFIKFSDKIKEMKFTAEILPHHSLLFYSIFSCYIDFTGGLMQNTFLLKGSLQYSWLYIPTRESKLTPSAVDGLLKSSFVNPERMNMLRKGLSFNIHSVNLTSELQEDFLRDLVAEKEKASIEQLLSFLYNKVPNQMKKLPNPEVRHVERFILAAYAKQLGFTADICQLSIQLASGNTPVVPAFITQAVQAVYKIRRLLRMSKQITLQYKMNFREGQEYKPSLKIEENYPEFIRSIMKKCVYLIHIQPCLREMPDQETMFPTMLKKLSDFITADITLESYFDQIVSAKKAREMIGRGVRYINEIIENAFSPLASLIISFVLEKFSTSEGMQTLVETDINIAGKDGVPVEIQETRRLMDIVVDLVANLEGECARNTFITFFANTAFAVGQIYPSVIIEPTVNLIKILITDKKYFSADNSKSLISMLVSMLWVLSQMSNDFANSDVYKKMYTLLLSSCELDSSDPSSIQLFYRSGMDIDVHPQVVIDHLFVCPPKEYPEYISVLGEICVSLNQRAPYFYWILHEIASICSGGPSSFMEEYPPLSEKSLINQKYCKTPSVILSGCINLIQLVRRFLNNSSSPAGRTMMNIFVYILNSFAKPKEEIEVQNNEEDLTIFNDPMLLYAVFAVLSNVIESVSFGSIMKDPIKSSLYYIADISTKEKVYKCWQIPIAGDSVLTDIKMNENMILSQSTPFTPSTFPLYDALVPVFLKFLALKNPTPMFEGLSYYVFASMKEYCTELNFFNRLVDEQIYDILPEFTFDNCNEEFMTIIRSHLSTNTNGFNEPRNNVFKFEYAAPGVLKEVEDLVFTDTHMECKKALHVFISPVFIPGHDFVLTINMKNIEQNFDAGFYHLSLSESNIKSLMFSKRGFKSYITGRTKENLTSINTPKKEVELRFNTNTSECIISDPQEQRVLMNHVFQSNMICFVVVLYPGANFDYSLSSTNTVKPQGKMVFSRNRNKKLITNKDFRINSITAKTDITSLNITSNPYVPLTDIECERFKAPRITQPFAQYPDCLKPKEFSIISSDKSVPQDPVIYQKYDVQETELIHFNPPPNSYFVLKDNKNDELVQTVLNPFNPINVDTFTGEIIKKERFSEFGTREILPLIHPCNFHILPPEILNQFATGYAKKLKKSLLSTILLQCYSPSSIGIEEALLKFNLDNLEALFQSLMSLLTTIEPFDLTAMSENKTPINFDLNLLDPNVLQPKSSYFLQKNAITYILDYIKKTNKSQEFLELWFKHLIREFNDPTSHSVKPNHPHAILVDPSNLTSSTQQNSKTEQAPAYETVSKLGAVKWILVRTGFMDRDEETCVINTYSPPKTHKFSSKLLLIYGSAFSISEVHQSTKGSSKQKKIDVNPNKKKEKIAAIPIMKDNELTSNALFGTFFDLIVSLKYFVYALNIDKKIISFTQLQKFRARIYCAFFDAFIGNSPFFVTFGHDVIKFLQNYLPIMCSDFDGGLLARINFLYVYCDKKRFSYLSGYLDELQALWDEKFFFGMKYFFPYFCSERDQFEMDVLVKNEKPEFILPTDTQFPDVFDQDTPKQKLFIMLKRIFMPRDNPYGFPFPQILIYWMKYSTLCPPTEISTISSKIIKIRFTEYTPKTAILQITQITTGLKLIASFEEEMTNSFEIRIQHSFSLNGNSTLFVEITDDKNVWELLNPFIISKDYNGRTDYEEKNREVVHDFILSHRDWFVKDISQLLFQWDENTDRIILNTFEYSDFTNKKLQVSIDPHQLAFSSLSRPLNVLCLRAHFLLILNWFYSNQSKEKFMQDSSSKFILPLISKKLKLNNFRTLVRSKAHSRHPSLSIDRKAALDVREGVSTNLKMTIVGQMVQYYTNPSEFRDASDKPWEVKFKNESGIDAGGLARELVAELAIDICSVNCGLVIPTPNSRNDIGQYRDCVIPFPNPKIPNIEARYRIFGAEIAIAIRTGLVQTFNFPPLVWEYLVSGDLTIDLIFEIDDNYKVLIESFKEAQRSGMSDDAFKARLNHKFVISDSRGNEMPLMQRGRQESVTASNCAQFISLANEFRLNELKPYLKMIRDGMWENIGLSPVQSLDWQTLEYAACGEREITFEALRKVTAFEGLDKKQEGIFLKVIETLTSEQRSLLLRFATGRIRLPPNCDSGNFLKVDSAYGVDKMPTASTCFHQLHLPTYTSFEKACKLITIAIEYTGTMELR